MKALRILLVATVLTACVASLALAQYVYPSVAFSFDENTFTYTYTVTVTQYDSFPLGYVEVDTMVMNAGITAWTASGPRVGATELNWATTTNKYDWIGDPNVVGDWYDAAIWYADIANGQHEIDPRALSGDWVGVFTLVAPNTAPTGGWALTMDGAEPSQNAFQINVPGPGQLIPEPSSLLALASGLVGFGGFAIRRRRA